jgi:exodeoxyribonuclease III
MSPSGLAAHQLRVATWNLNSLRARTSAVDRFLERAQPDVLCVQETKSADISPHAMAVFDRHGYHVVHVGVGAYNRGRPQQPPAVRDVLASGEFDDAAPDREPRLITARVDVAIPMRIVSVSCPTVALSITGTSSTSSTSSTP